MGKKRKSLASSLDEVDRTMYSTFCSAANSLSHLYTQAMNQQKFSFQAGERHGLEKLYQWILRQQEGGSRVINADVISYLQIGQGTYSNVYKARDRDTGKIVALKKVRFDTSEPESVKFMAREIMILQKLDHPNVVKLEGLATSRMQYSIYLVFDFMLSDLARIISRPDERLTEPQVKCYMLQLLSGLQHCHERGILHRDIKGSNLLIDKNGMLKIADFGLANHFNPKNKNRPLTSRVVTLWYRAPELLLGATDYGVGIDLWSAGCLMAEMVAGRPIMPGRTEFFHTSPLPCDLSGLPVVHMEDDDEPRQTFERRKRRNSKMKQRSLTQKENMRRDHEDTEYPPRVFAYSNEEQDQSKITGMPFPDLEPSSSMTSTSSGSKQTGSPIPKNTKNRPPLPNNIKQTASKYNNVDNGNFYGLSRVQRSISTREFRKLDQRNYYKMDAFKD